MRTVYLADGTQATELCVLPDHGHLVMLALEGGEWDEEGAWGGQTAIFVPQVWDSPPVALKNQEIVRLEQRIAALRQEAEELDGEIAQRRRDEAERLKTFAKWDQLHTLEAFLAGEVTHFVMTGEYGGLAVVTMAQALEDRSGSYRNEMKLVSLFGNSKGDLNWRVNHYKDGSGGWHTFIPANSEEQAKAIAFDIFQKAIQELETAGDKAPWQALSQIRDGLAMGFEAPQWVKERDRQNRIDNIRSQMKTTVETAARYQAQIAAIEAEGKADA